MEAQQFLTCPVLDLQRHGDPRGVSQELNRVSGTPSNDRYVPPQALESHPFFGTLFRVWDSHTFWRNLASGGEGGSNSRKSAAEFEPFRELTASSSVSAIQFRKSSGQHEWVN
jgi:hypothetical protein